MIRPSFGWVCCPAIAWILLGRLLFPEIAVAQSTPLRGIVLDSESREPIEGAVISMLDRAGNAARHVISGGDGRFAIADVGEGDQLRVRRIGFQPRDVRLEVSDLGAPPLTIALTRIPQILSAVRVTESPLCPGGASHGAASALWDQARDALFATVVARDALRARTEVLSHEVTQAPGDARVLRYDYRIRTGWATRPFRAAASAVQFATRGFVEEDYSGRTFNAPDADVLLDSAFAASHCFHIVPAPARRPGQIGLGFEPARRRTDIVDVEGVVWLDADTPALRELEFRYTGLDRASTTAGAGGTVHFATADNGVVLVSRWNLRMPVVAQRSVSSIQAPTGPPTSVGGWTTRSAGRELVVTEIRETGGLVTAATWGDGTRWTQSLAQLRGTVTDHDNGSPVRGALVTLAGGSDSVLSDSTGRFVLARLIAGRYDVLSVDTSLAEYVGAGAATRTTVEIVHGTAVEVTLRVPPIAARVAELCDDAAPPPRTSLLLGRIRGGDAIVSGTEVRAAWQDEITVSSGGMALTEARRAALTDSSGRFYVCGVARERPVRLSVVRDGMVIGDTTILVSTKPIERVDIDIRRRTLARGVLTGVVRNDSTEAPIEGAHVGVPVLGRVTRTNARGEFRFDSLPPGTLSVSVRALGFAPDSASVVILVDRRTEREIALSALSRLAPLTVVGADTAYLSVAMRGFEERRRRGIGRFVSEEELRQRATAALGPLLEQRIPGIRAVTTGAGTFLASSRSVSDATGRALGARTQPGTCWVTIYLDGVLIYDGSQTGTSPPNFDRFQTEMITAVEFYGPATAPPEFRGGSGCGTLVLWTRQRQP